MRDGERVDSGTVGRWGEHLAERWLRKNGRKVLYRNYRGPNGGEVDIVARHGAVLTFVEVKTRTSDDYGRPGDAVNAAKQDLIFRGARAWLRMLKDGDRIRTRCDVAEIVLIHGEKPRVNVVEGAFREL
jgi:putative endonuclease